MDTLFGPSGVPDLGAVRPWPHQERGVDEVLTRVARGVPRILLTSPTGGGKSLMMALVARAGLLEGWGVVLFTNRKLLLEQMGRAMRAFGFEHGVRAADHDADAGAPLQIASVQTEYSRVVKRGTGGPHPNTRLVLIDEAHLNATPQVDEVLAAYRRHEPGLTVVGVTATPLGLSGRYDELVVAGTSSELRACGALVPAAHHGADEPDLRNVRKVPLGEDYSEPDVRKLVMVPGVHGRVIEWFRRLNPEGLPSIGFAPGVPESVGFAEAFERAGIPAAHIDGERIWIRGAEAASTPEKRDELLALSRSGEVRIVWNRYVLREAIDMPWLRHGILATVFGSLQSYLQSGGRLLRACPSVGKRDVCVQDHGGNWWRHGSLNADRHWRLTDTAGALAAERQRELAGDSETPPREPEPFRCNGCSAVLVLRTAVGRKAFTLTCPQCGFRMDFRRRSRPVVQADGELVEHEGAVFRPRRVERKPDTAALWEKVYWRCRRAKKTFNQAVGLFYTEHGYFPPRDLPLMPRAAHQWYLGADKVPHADLFPKGPGGDR